MMQDNAEREAPKYEIVVWKNDQWDAGYVGDENYFETEAVALAAIPTLRAFGQEWSTARYGVREIGSAIVIEAEGNDGDNDAG